MTLENTKKKIKAEKLPVWFLYIINSRGVPALISKFQEDDIARSVKYLDEQVSFFSDEKQETCFEIKAQAKISSNGPNAVMSWEFCVPPTKKAEDPGARLNGNDYGLGMLQNSYVQRELDELRADKRDVQAKRDFINKEEIRLMIESKDLEREKALWEKERQQKETDWNKLKADFEVQYKKMEIIFNDNKEHAKAAWMELFGNGLFPLLNQAKAALTGDGLSGSEKPKTEKEKLVESIGANILTADLTTEEITIIGIHVQKLKEKLQAKKREPEAEAV